MEMNLQRGKWRPWSNVNEFLGYDPPDVTVYTGISAGYYCLIFAIISVAQMIVIFVLSIKDLGPIILSLKQENINGRDQFR